MKGKAKEVDDGGGREEGWKLGREKMGSVWPWVGSGVRRNEERKNGRDYEGREIRECEKEKRGEKRGRGEKGGRVVEGGRGEGGKERGEEEKEDNKDEKGRKLEQR